MRKHEARKLRIEDDEQDHEKNRKSRQDDCKDACNHDSHTDSIDVGIRLVAPDFTEGGIHLRLFRALLLVIPRNLLFLDFQEVVAEVVALEIVGGKQAEDGEARDNAYGCRAGQIHNENPFRDSLFLVSDASQFPSILAESSKRKGSTKKETSGHENCDFLWSDE